MRIEQHFGEHTIKAFLYICVFKNIIEQGTETAAGREGAIAECGLSPFVLTKVLHSSMAENCVLVES